MPKQKNKSSKSLLAILVRVTLGLGLLGLLLAVLLPLGAYFYVAKSLPRVDTLADYRPPIITRVLSDNGTVIAELYEERAKSRIQIMLYAVLPVSVLTVGSIVVLQAFLITSMYAVFLNLFGGMGGF